MKNEDEFFLYEGQAYDTKVPENNVKEASFRNLVETYKEEDDG